MAGHTEQSTYGLIDHAYVDRLRATPREQDSPFLMLNLMRYHDLAIYPEGHPDAGAGVTGRAADDRYAPVEILHEVGGVVEQEGGDHPWDRVAVVRYPSVRSFLEMQDRPDFIARRRAPVLRRDVIRTVRPLAPSV